MKYHKQLKDQAAEYKVIIQHHRSVNEKILVDKELSQNCCNLAAILCAAESKVNNFRVKDLSVLMSYGNKTSAFCRLKLC